jgi:hypothetical protein
MLFLFYLYLAVIDDVVEGLQFSECGNDIIWTNDRVFQQHNIVSTAAVAPRLLLRQFGFVPKSDTASAEKRWHHPLFTAHQRDLRQLVDLPREFWSSSAHAAKTPASGKTWLQTGWLQFLTPQGYFGFNSAPASPRRNSPRTARPSRAATSVRAPFGTVVAAVDSDAAASREPLSVDEAIEWCKTFGRSDGSAMQQEAGIAARAVKRVRVLSRSVNKRLRDRRACSNSNAGNSSSYSSSSNSSSSSKAGVADRAVKSLTTLSRSISTRLNEARGSGGSDSINSTCTTSTSECSNSSSNSDSSSGSSSNSSSSSELDCSCTVQ